MLPKGILMDCLCVCIGTNLGCSFKHLIPQQLKSSMNNMFGIAAIAIGLTSIIKLSSLPAVILALLLGALIGEVICLDHKVKTLFLSLFKKLRLTTSQHDETYMNFFLIVAVTFCASGTNIFGAFQEGVTGDYSILLSKAVMDIFAAAIFAATLGRVMNILIPLQFIILCVFFYASRFVMPYLSNDMLQDFVAIGGLLTFVLGLSIANIKSMSAVNLLPALVLIFPCSFLFSFL